MTNSRPVLFSRHVSLIGEVKLRIQLENLRKRDHSKYLDVDERIILKCTLRK
jgi:hypothetical protein